MYKLVFFLPFFLLLSSSIKAEDTITYSETVQVDSVSQRDLMIKARYWSVQTVQISKEDIIVDTEIGRLFSTASTGFESKSFFSNDINNGVISYTIQLDVQDGQYKYTFSNFRHRSYNATGANFGLITKEGIFISTQKPTLMSNKRIAVYHKELLEEIEKSVQRQIQVLKTQMNKKEGELSLVRSNSFLYTDFVPVTNGSVDKIYERCRLWFAEKYVNSKGLLLIEDKSLGELYGVTTFPYEVKLKWYSAFETIIKHGIRIQIKEDGFQYYIFNISYKVNNINGYSGFYFLEQEDDCASKKRLPTKACELIKEQINMEVDYIVGTLVATVNRQEGLLAEIQEEGVFLFSKVVPVSNRSKDKLFEAGRRWLLKTFESGRHSIDIQDKEAGELYGKFYFDYKPPLLKGGLRSQGVIWFDLHLQIQDGKYEYIMSNFYHDADPSLNHPLSYGLIANEEDCFHIPNILSEDKKQKFCNYLRECIDSNSSMIEQNLENAMKNAM